MITTMPDRPDDAPSTAGHGRKPLSDAALERISELYLEGGASLADISRRTGVPITAVRRACRQIASRVARGMSEPDRYAERWAAARSMRLTGLAARMARAQEELSYAKKRRESFESDDMLDPRVLAWTEAIGRIEDRLRAILREYTDTMAAIPPAEILRMELAGDIQDREAFLKGAAAAGRADAGGGSPGGTGKV